MVEFSAEERAYLNDMRMLSTDDMGNEVFVGLTITESHEYYQLTQLDRRTDGDGRSANRYLELYGKHEKARMRVLGAEIAARHNAPVRR
jgi:hypothetical protein